MPVSIRGTGGGGVILDAGAASTETTLTLPNVTGTILQSGTAVTIAQGGTGLTSTGAAGNVLFTTNGTTWSSTAKIVSGTAVASTSGTSIDFTNIPSWVKRITVMFSGVSTTGSSPVIVQLGISSGPVTSGYLGASTVTSSGVVTVNLSSGFQFYFQTQDTSGSVRHGSFVASLVGSNTWSSAAAMGLSNFAAHSVSSGSIALGATLDRVRITTVGGTDTFDAGTINIMYE